MGGGGGGGVCPPVATATALDERKCYFNLCVLVPITVLSLVARSSITYGNVL